MRGMVGERFAVRNSGAHAVVEGVGDHGCEYMTGGRVVILGETGRNFAAGMSGGVAYVYDPDGELPTNLNTEMVDARRLSTTHDVEWLHDMISRARRRHRFGCRASGSWPTGRDRQRNFVKVMPRDYKKVLQAIAEAEATATDVDKAIMAAAHG